MTEGFQKTEKRSKKSEPVVVSKPKAVSPPKEEVPTGVGGSFKTDENGVRTRVKDSTKGG